MAKQRTLLPPARPNLERIFAQKKEHAVRRCAQRCERRYRDYKRLVRERAAERVLSESNTRHWYCFQEPSGRKVYGLWSDTREIFFTFLTEDMFHNRMKLEAGDWDAYRPGAHRRNTLPQHRAA